jgi:hypothetical protein
MPADDSLEPVQMQQQCGTPPTQRKNSAALILAIFKIADKVRWKRNPSFSQTLARQAIALFQIGKAFTGTPIHPNSPPEIWTLLSRTRRFSSYPYSSKFPYLLLKDFQLMSNEVRRPCVTVE